ncbi:MAG: hypothetical protein HYY16_19400 [Planctomycetes bacterium]|nr:hypothetical protein [Planctomycetota bacterium]
MRFRLAGGVLVSLSALAIVGCHYASRMISTRDYRSDPTAKFRDVDLSILVRNPQAAGDVEFDAIFRQHNEVVWAPHFTVFTPEDFASFSVWPISAPLWEASGRVSYVPTLYIHKEANPDFDGYLLLRKYERVHIRGTVRSDFENRPWIEIVSIRSTGDFVYSDKALSHLLAGLRDADEKRHASAIQHLTKALEGPLGVPAQFAVYMKLGWLFEWRAATTRNVSDWEDAHYYYELAVALQPHEHEAIQALQRTSRAIDANGIAPAPPEPGNAPVNETSRSTNGTHSPGADEWQKRWEAERAERMKAEAAAKLALDEKTAVDARIVEMETALSQATTESEALKVAIEETAKNLESAETEKGRAMTEAAEAKAAIPDLLKKIEETEKAFVEANSAAEQSRKDLEDLRQQVASGSDTSEAAMKKVQALEGENAKLREDAKAAEKRLEEVGLRAAADQASAKAAQEKLRTLEEARTKLQGQMKVTETMLTEANEAKTRVQAELDELRRQVASGGDTAKVAIERVQILEGENAKLREQVHLAQKDLTEANEAKSRVEAELEEARRAPAFGGDTGDAAKFEAEKKKLEEQIQALSAERDEWRSRAEATPVVEGGDEELRKQLATKEEELAQLKAERDGLQKRLAEQPAGSPEVEELRKEIEKRETEIGARDEEIQGLKDSRDMQALVIKNLRDRNDELEKENEELRKKVEEK